MFYPDSRYFIGQVKNFKKEGRGRLYYGIKGNFGPVTLKDDENTNSKTQINKLTQANLAPNPLSDVLYYQGQFTQDRMEGKGFLFLKDGRVFSGNFK